MVSPTAGEVVLVPFPFSDLSQSKVRPAVCLANAGRGDWILCQVTSNSYGDRRAVPIATSDFALRGLKLSSYARPGKLFTANNALLVASVGKLTDAAFQRILGAVMSMLGSKGSP